MLSLDNHKLEEINSRVSEFFTGMDYEVQSCAARFDVNDLVPLRVAVGVLSRFDDFSVSEILNSKSGLSEYCKDLLGNLSNPDKLLTIREIFFPFIIKISDLYLDYDDRGSDKGAYLAHYFMIDFTFDTHAGV